MGREANCIIRIWLLLPCMAYALSINRPTIIICGSSTHANLCHLYRNIHRYAHDLSPQYYRKRALYMTKRDNSQSKDGNVEDNDNDSSPDKQGFLRNIFRRNKNNDDAEGGINITVKVEAKTRKDVVNSVQLRKQVEEIQQIKSPKAKQKQAVKLDQELRQAAAQQTESSPSILRRIQSVIPFVGTSNNNDNSNDTKTPKTEDTESSSNTFSTITKFITSKFPSGDNDDSKESLWIPVFPKTRIDPGEVVPVTIAGIDLLVIASADGRKLYCIANSCPHLGTPLETGQIVRLPATGLQREKYTFADKGDSSNNNNKNNSEDIGWTEVQVSNLLQQDGCEDCIVCPLHRTAFALQSGEVRGEWCPYPPVIGKLMGTVKQATPVAIFDVRYRGKFVQVRLNTPLEK